MEEGFDTKEVDERRHGYRIPLALPIKGKCMGTASEGNSFEGETKDVSFEGMCVRLNSQVSLHEGQDITFRTRLYPGDFFLNAEGTVRWVSPCTDSESPGLVGVKINRMRRYSLWIERIEDKIIQTLQ